jgi:hypothetical protein
MLAYWIVVADNSRANSRNFGGVFSSLRGARADVPMSMREKQTARTTVNNEAILKTYQHWINLEACRAKNIKNWARTINWYGMG